MGMLQFAQELCKDVTGSQCSLLPGCQLRVVNGVACAIIIMSRKQPVLSSTDMIYARAIGLIALVGLSVSLDIEVSNMVYQIKVGR